MDIAPELDPVDHVLTDPPYALAFMGRKWDTWRGPQEYQEWCARRFAAIAEAMKPGAHLLAFGGTRTWHRLTSGVEEAGLEVRDCLMWMYGSGFPKSLDVSKAIDKRRDWAKVEALSGEIKRARAAAGLSLAEMGAAMQSATDGQYGKWYHRGGHMFFETGRSLPSRPEWEQLRTVLPIRPRFQDVYEEAERQVVGSQKGTTLEVAPGQARPRLRTDLEITAPALPEAAQWSGWGTALKPAWEPIILARKPLSEKTVAANVLKHGTGAINVDGCRIGTEARPLVKPDRHHGTGNSWDGGVDGSLHGSKACGSTTEGRWPANLLLTHDERCVCVGKATLPGKPSDKRAPTKHEGPAKFGYSENRHQFNYEGETQEVWACVPSCPVRMLDSQSGITQSSGKTDRRRGSALNGWGPGDADGWSGGWHKRGTAHADAGGASRFFYTGKASKRDRGHGNSHPTVKPQDLLRYLLRLTAPQGATVLDPFMGSGSTLVAAREEGHKAIGIDTNEEYCEIAANRLSQGVLW
jgi:hypothetical protein